MSKEGIFVGNRMCVYFPSLLKTLGFKNEVLELLKPHKLGGKMYTISRDQGTFMSK